MESVRRKRRHIQYLVLGTIKKQIKMKIILKLAFLFFTVTSFSQINSLKNDDFFLRDSIVKTVPTQELRDVIKEINFHYLEEGLELDTNQVLTKYKIVRRKDKEILILDSRKLEFKPNKEYVTNAIIEFNKEEFPNKTLPIIKYSATKIKDIHINNSVIKNQYFQIKAEIRLYNHNFWVATKNSSLLNCGYLLTNQSEVYKNGKWIEFESISHISDIHEL